MSTDDLLSRIPELVERLLRKHLTSVDPSPLLRHAADSLAAAQERIAFLEGENVRLYEDMAANLDAAEVRIAELEAENAELEAGVRCCKGCPDCTGIGVREQILGLEQEAARLRLALEAAKSALADAGAWSQGFETLVQRTLRLVDQALDATEDSEPQSKSWSVEVYEPAIDPGGYEDRFIVAAPTVALAQDRALEAAQRRWPDNKGLALGLCDQTDEVDR